MRLRVEIDDQLMALAMVSGCFNTPKEAVEKGLRALPAPSVKQSA